MTTPKNIPEVGNDALLVVNRRIQKEADNLGLKISDYEGFARGGWNIDGNGCRPSGQWVFSIEAADPSKTTDHEPANVSGDNITDALEQMREWAKYLFD